MPEVWPRSRDVIEESYPQITWEHSHVVVDDDGVVRTYCIYAAPDESILRKYSAQLGKHRLEGVYEIAGDVTPDDFPG